MRSENSSVNSLTNKPVLTPNQISNFEKFLIEEEGISIDYLINRASGAVASQVRKMSKSPTRVLGLIGKGNNGKDCIKALRWLRLHGYQIGAIIFGNDGLAKRNDIKKLISISRIIVNAKEKNYFKKVLKFRPEVIVDGVFGIGFRLPLPLSYGEIFNFLNKLPAYRLAVDVPSGVDIKTGEADTNTFFADETITFFSKKPGHLFPPGKLLSGKVVVADLGYSRLLSNYVLQENVKPAYEAGRAIKLPRRGFTAHKKTSKVLVVAGSNFMPGAAMLASKAAYIAGAGYVAIASTKRVCEFVNNYLPEAVSIPLKEKEGAIADTEVEKILRVVKDFDACLIGPGLSRADSAQTISVKLFEKLPKKCIFDGDALYSISKKEIVKSPYQRILTPHEGEAKRLVGNNVVDKISTAKEISKQYECVTVLKGATTVISDYSNSEEVGEIKQVFVSDLGNNILATAGTGDILAGIISSFVSQNMSIIDSALSGVFLHGKASNDALESYNGAPIKASDLFTFLRKELKGVCGGCES